MPNHFHIVLRQGMRPLGWIMQPIMRRTALMVQRRFEMSGHIFERRFRSTICRDADHLRRAIVYTNLNPERAGICAADAYQWSSALLYRDGADAADKCNVAINSALQLFAGQPDMSEMQLRACYRRYVAWRLEKDRQDACGMVATSLEPLSAAGDAYFLDHFCAIPPMNGRPSADLRDRAHELLRSISETVTIESLRRSRLSRRCTDIRRQLIASLLQQRYRVCDIASFLRISDSAVSRIAIAMRYGAPA
jgi:hypothetical protein